MSETSLCVSELVVSEEDVLALAELLLQLLAASTRPESLLRLTGLAEEWLWIREEGLALLLDPGLAERALLLPDPDRLELMLVEADMDRDCLRMSSVRSQRQRRVSWPTEPNR